MNIAIVGYGNMGHEIEKLARAKGMKVISIIDPNSGEATHKEISEESVKNADVCIDFTHPGAAMGNVEKIAKFRKNIVLGTTGWYGNIEQVRNIVQQSNIGLIYASNFSIGVNIFFRIVENAAKIINNVNDYDIFSYELHHNKKVDSPSGTAKTIGEILIKNIERKDKLVFDKLDRKIEPNELHIASVRAGSFPGTHVVGFDSRADTIELTHTNRNRDGLAMGAIMAAEWIKGRKGFYDIGDMMKSMIN